MSFTSPENLELAIRESAPGYGESATSWPMVRLGAITAIATGSTPPTQDASSYGGEYPFASPADITDEKYVSKTRKGLSQRGMELSRRFPAGSVLFVCIGSTIGKCAIAVSDMTSNQQINAVFPSVSLNSEFAYYWLSSKAASVRASASEQAVPLVSKSQFSLLEIPLPPLTEQRAIAEALGDVDALIAAQQKLIAKKRAIKTATMQRLLTSKQRLPGYEDQWETASLVELSTQIMDYRGRTPKKLGMAWGGGSIPAVSALNVKMGYIDQTRDCHLASPELYQAWMKQGDPREGDLLFTTEAPLGNVALVENDDKFILSQRVVLIRPNEKLMHSGFFSHLLRGQRFQDALVENSSGSTATGIKRRILEQIQLVRPPLSEQRAIAQVLTDMEAEVTALEKRLAKTKDIKQGMMQELLTGRTRLV